MENFAHITVLLEETVDAVLPSAKLLTHLEKTQSPFVAADCTLGGGGHALLFLEKVFNLHKENLVKKMIFFVIDRDSIALEFALQRLKASAFYGDWVQLVPIHNNFSALTQSMMDKGVKQIHSLYADLGVSSPQLDVAERGFSINKNGPMDMRMDNSSSLTAKIILSTFSDSDLADIFYKYGEEPKSRILAKAILLDRKQGTLPLESTAEFAQYVTRVLNYKNSKSNPATRIFQALRIAVNDELGSLERLLKELPLFASFASQFAFISFHSLEDRIVKNSFRAWQKGHNLGEEKNELHPFHFPMVDVQSWGKEVPRGGITPSGQETTKNPRSRSARLRVFEFASDYNNL